MAMRAIGYIRCSTQEQADSGLGLEAQAERIRAYCTIRELELLDIVTDVGVSGGKTRAKQHHDSAGIPAARGGQGVGVGSAQCDQAPVSPPSGDHDSSGAFHTRTLVISTAPVMPFACLRVIPRRQEERMIWRVLPGRSGPRHSSGIEIGVAFRAQK